MRALVSTSRFTGRSNAATAAAKGSHCDRTINVSITVIPSSSTTTPALATPARPPGWIQAYSPSPSSVSARSATPPRVCRAGDAICRTPVYPHRMSERSRNLPRRTCLAVPGSSEKMIGKAPGLGADMVFLDLEDSVAPLEKEAARDNVVRAIRELDWGETVVCVRVNAWDTKWTYRDVIHVVENAGERLDEVMLPKTQAASDVRALDLLLTQIEETIGRESRVGIEAQIETAQGLINVEEICAASPRME